MKENVEVTETFEERSEIKKFTLKTSLNAYNEHATNIVALKRQILLNKTNLPEEEYKIMMGLAEQILKVDNGIWLSINKQNTRSRKIRQTRASNKVAVCSTHRKSLGRGFSA